MKSALTDNVYQMSPYPCPEGPLLFVLGISLKLHTWLKWMTYYQAPIQQWQTITDNAITWISCVLVGRHLKLAPEDQDWEWLVSMIRLCITCYWPMKMINNNNDTENFSKAIFYCHLFQVFNIDEACMLVHLYIQFFNYILLIL